MASEEREPFKSMESDSRTAEEGASATGAMTPMEKFRDILLGQKRSLLLRRFLLLLAVANVGYQLFVKLPAQWLETSPSREAYDYYLASHRFLDGEKLYRPWPEYGPRIISDYEHPYPADRFPYPPPVAVAISPLVKTQFYIFGWRWSMLMFAAFWVYAWCLAKMAKDNPTGQDILLAGLAISFVPWSTVPFFTGIIDPIMWALFGLALVTPFRGAAFMASAWVKLYALWPMLFAWRREGNRILKQALVVFIIGFAIGSLAGVRSYYDWAKDFLPVISQGTFFKHNLSLSFVGLRFARLLGWRYEIGPLPLLARIYLDVMEVIGPLLFGWLSRKKKPEIQYACVTAGAILFGPLCWTTYLPILLAPATLLLREWLEEPTAAQTEAV
jgi:hypothetical protein